MDAKLQILRDTFQSRFSTDNYLRFSKEFFGEIKIISPDKKNTSIPLEYRYMVAAYTHVASYRTGNDTLDIFSVKLNAGRSVERARSMQRSFISKLLTAANHDGAIVAFYTDSEPRWRLSFIRLDYEFAAGRVKMSLTPAKRYSYLVGEKEPCHTAMEQLYPIFRNENYKPTLEKIEEAFSVERVTQEFFDKYKERYFMLKEHLDGDEVFLGEAQKHGFTSEQFAKKLMGQLAFLYFLQKKGWLGVKVLPHTINEKTYKNAYYWSSATKEVIPKIYRHTAADEYSLAFSAVQTLSNAEVDAVAACFKSEGWGSGEKDFIRELFNKIKTKNFYDEFLEPLFYEALNQKRGESSYYKRFNCKIPFLNGGLFEPLEKYDWEHCKFSIPNELFSNVETKGERDADGILDIFDRYNFTMNEDEPMEREVAVDPEMLGKIFENLLDAKDRKSKGAFYTPREIVHYMCAESLINYLVGITGVPYEDMKSFISDGEFMKDEDYNKRQEDRKLPQTVYEKLRDIDKALETIKVADPAVGSGAFPLGMLSEIVKARNNITYYFASEFDKSEDRARLFDQRDPYRLKWDSIQNSIFAVDIEASAVDIAKLRLWLSLVVDESLDPTFDEQRIGNIKEKDPRPLPNLDYNIMCGNSLVDEFEGIKLFDDIVLGTEQTDHPHDGTEIQLSLFMDSMQMYLDDLRKEQGRLFGEQNPDTKQEIKRHIDKIIDNIIRAKLTKDNNGKGLKKYEESLKQKTKPYFLWKLEFAHVFREKGGFDIVIGNPPYIDSENMVNQGLQELRDYITSKYEYTKGNWDIYIAFFERGLNMLSAHGCLTYITPDKWISKSFGDALRINTIAYIKSILAAGRSVFESALVDSIITVFTKYENSQIDVFEMENKKSPICQLQTVNKDILNSPYALDIVFSKSIGLIQRLSKENRVLSDFFECENACATSDCYDLKEILFSLEDPTAYNEKIHLKVINTGTIGRFVPRWGFSPMKYLKDNYQYPVVNKEEFLSLFPNSYGRKSVKPKIIIKGLTLLDSCIDYEGAIIPGKSTMMISATSLEELYYLSAIINSNLMIYIIKQKYSSSSYNGGINFRKDMLNNLPFREISLQDKNAIVSLVSQIIDEKCNSPVADTSELEKEIDLVVYKIYDLTQEEIKFVESVK